MTDMIVTVQNYGFYDAAIETRVYEGIFLYYTEWNGKPAYYFDNHGFDGQTEILWQSGKWWLILDDSLRYESYDDTPTPDLATWVGCTVTAAGGGDQSGALRRTNMNAQMSNLTGGMHG